MDNKVIGALYCKAGMLTPNTIGLINHCSGVAHNAGYLARLLNEHSLNIDIETVETAAMLHDIGKMFNNDLWGHVSTGAEFLRGQKVPEEIVSLVARHQIWQNEVTEPLSWELKVLILGDLSFRERIMPIKERVEDIINRYVGNGIPPGEEKWLKKLSEDIQREILEIIKPQILPF